jgi:CRISPR/Cas system-associated exonuclease Cas4 (RecB family)
VIPIGSEKIKKQTWLTPTSINAYMHCPRKYYLKKIAKCPQKPTVYLIRGRAVHRTIELFYKLNINHCVLFNYSDFERILQDLFKQEWEDQKKSLKNIDLTDNEIDYYFFESCKMIKNFAYDFYNNQEFEKPSPVIEKNLISKKLNLKGRVDAIHYNRNARAPPLIIDYKTCQSKGITKEYKRQAYIYALLYYEQYKAIPHVGIQFLSFKDGLLKFPVTKTNLEETSNLVRKIQSRVLSTDIKDYPCTCGWCKNEFALMR